MGNSSAHPGIRESPFAHASIRKFAQDRFVGTMVGLASDHLGHGFGRGRWLTRRNADLFAVVVEGEAFEFGFGAEV